MTMDKKVAGLEQTQIHPIDVAVCPYCSHSASFFVSSTDLNRKTTDAVFQYYQCDSCGLVFMHPIPADMAPYYAGGYQEIPKDLAELRRIAKEETYRLEPILKYKSKGELLEIGPWIGIFGSNAKDAGFNVTAIDIDQKCVDFLNDTVGIKAIQSANPSATLAHLQLEQKFDVIALWHSLEHLPEPWLVVERAAQSLAPGGILLIAIPNIESYEFSFLKGGWIHLDAPRHIYFYPGQSLVDLCQRHGLNRLEVETNDELSVRLSRGSWIQWAARKVPARYVRILGRLSYGLARRQHAKKKDTGAGMTAVFQRPETAVRVP
jgi:SAM-dependent methyltransferase